MNIEANNLLLFLCPFLSLSPPTRCSTVVPNLDFGYAKPLVVYKRNAGGTQCRIDTSFFVWHVKIKVNAHVMCGFAEDRRI